MGTTTRRRRNTSFELAREHEEDGYTGIAFSSKPFAETREKGRSKEGGRQSAIIHVFAMEAY
jgi:hypothetical protein